MQIETDPVLRSDPLWLALENAIAAITDDPSILRGKKLEWEGGLNSTVINELAAEAGLSDHPVYREPPATMEGELTQVPQFARRKFFSAAEICSHGDGATVLGRNRDVVKTFW